MIEKFIVTCHIRSSSEDLVNRNLTVEIACHVGVDTLRVIMV